MHVDQIGPVIHLSSRPQVSTRLVPGQPLGDSRTHIGPAYKRVDSAPCDAPRQAPLPSSAATSPPQSVSTMSQLDIHSTGSAAAMASNSLANAMGSEPSNHLRALGSLAAANSLAAVHSSLSAPVEGASMAATVQAQPEARAETDDAMPLSTGASVAASSSSCKQQALSAAPENLQAMRHLRLQASSSSGDPQVAQAQQAKQAEHSRQSQEVVGSESAMLPLELPSPLQDSRSSDSQSSGSPLPNFNPKRV